MTFFRKFSLLLCFATLTVIASGCSREAGDIGAANGGGGGGNAAGTETGADTLEVKPNVVLGSVKITTVAEVEQELKDNGGNMIPLFETVPNLLAEYVDQDADKLATLNKQLKDSHVKRSNLGQEKTKTTEQTVEDGGDENVPFQLGDLVPMADDEFPELADLDADAEWADKPVLDAMDLMRQRQENEEAEATIEEAMALVNDSPVNNSKIRSAIGRLASLDGSNADFNASWSRHTAGDVRSTNPLMASSSAEFDVSGLINFGLLGFDWTFTPYGSKDGIVSWQTSSDGLYDKIVLRDDLIWSDGTPITAHDVEFSYKVIMTSKVPVPAVRSGTDQLLGVKAYDDRTVVFFHPDSLATNVWNILFPIIPKHVFEASVAEDPTMQSSAYHVEKDENPVTGGAYVITKRVRGQEITLERRESYHTVDGTQVRAIPYFKNIRFTIIEDPNTALLSLKKGDIDEYQLTPPQWTDQTGDEEFYNKNTKAYDIEWVYFYFGWNNRSHFFRDVRVRKAMGLAYDHNELLTRHRNNLDEAARGIFHSTSPWSPETLPESYKQDLDLAEELLAEAGWEDTDDDGILDGMVFIDDGFDGQIDSVQRVPFKFTIVSSNRPDRVAMCELLQENLDQIGIECSVSPVEFTTLQDRSRKHQFHAQFGGWGTGTDPDTSENLWATKAIDSGRNYVCYSSPEIDQLFIDGKYELDPDKRREIYRQIHLKLYEDQPYTWLYYRNAYFAFNKELRGVNFSARGPYSYGPGESSIFKSPAMQ